MARGKLSPDGVSDKNMNTISSKINPKKLLNSKWTAVKPVNKEKHFIVTEISVDDDGEVISCSIEAVISRRLMPIHWTDLNDRCVWAHGWQ
jgi:tryptophan-rich hypothetical protein